MRAFYEDYKFDRDRDFPKFTTDDEESWIELEFCTTPDEQHALKTEYQSADSMLRVRKYLRSNLVKNGQSNIYAYENGTLSANLFYGAKNISQAKLGNILYVPELSKCEEAVKLSGPSPLRDMINLVMKKVMKHSASYEELNSAFDKFNGNFQSESSADGFSLKTLATDINKEMSDWNVKFHMDINPVSPDDIIKNLITNSVEDAQIPGNKIGLHSFGQGFQRHFIYTLIRLAAKYVETKSSVKKEFAPDFTLVLFEEPEAFLHPAQQETLNLNLMELSKDLAQQILITTHSPIFVSRNIENIVALVRVQRNDGISKTFNLIDPEVKSLIIENDSLAKHWEQIMADPKTPADLRAKINKKFSSASLDLQTRLDKEAIRYLLWLDSERCTSFEALGKIG